MNPNIVAKTDAIVKVTLVLGLELVEDVSSDPASASAEVLDEDLLSLHLAATWSRISVCSETPKSGIMQSPKPIASISSHSSMQAVLAHISSIWSVVRDEMILKPMSFVHPAKFELLAIV